MQINKLTLKDFGVIKDAEFNFRPGVNLIIGDNGNGKTHILKALAFLLINYKEKTIEDYCNWDSEKFTITLDLDHLQKKFDFNYKYNRESNSLIREVKIENEFFKGQDAINELAKYFDPTLCRASIISFQGKVDLVDAKPAERRESLKKIYDLDFSKQVKELDEEIKGIEENRLKELNDNILILKNKEYNFKDPLILPNSGADYKNHQISLLKLQNKITLIQKEIEEYNRKFLQQQSMQKDIKKSKNELDNYELKIYELERVILSDKESLKGGFEGKLCELNKELQQDFEIKKKELEEKIVNIKLTRVPIFDEVKLKELQKIREDLAIKWHSAKRQYELCLQGKCPTCGNIFNSTDIEKYETDMSTSKVLLDAKVSQIAELEIKKLEVQKQKDNMLALKNQKEVLIIKLNAEIKDIENKKERILKNIEIEKKDIEHRKTLYQNDINQSENQIIQIKQEQEKEQIRLTLLQKNLQNLNILDEVPSIKEQDTADMVVLKILISDFDSIVEQNKLIVKQNEQLKIDNKNDIEILKLKRTERDSIIIDVERLRKGKVVLQKEFPNYVISTMLDDTEDGINELVEKVYDGKYEVKVVENKGGIDVLYGKRQTSIEIASGFEKDLFNFGYKHAFSQIAGLGVLLLDEIDAFASDENSGKLFGIIGELRTLYKQIFIITHKTTVQEILQRDYHANVFEITDGKVQNYY